MYESIRLIATSRDLRVNATISHLFLFMYYFIFGLGLMALLTGLKKYGWDFVDISDLLIVYIICAAMLHFRYWVFGTPFRCVNLVVFEQGINYWREYSHIENTAQDYISTRYHLHFDRSIIVRKVYFPFPVYRFTNHRGASFRISVFAFPRAEWKACFDAIQCLNQSRGSRAVFEEYVRQYKQKKSITSYQKPVRWPWLTRQLMKKISIGTIAIVLFMTGVYYSYDSHQKARKFEAEQNIRYLIDKTDNKYDPVKDRQQWLGKTYDSLLGNFLDSLKQDSSAQKYTNE